MRKVKRQNTTFQYTVYKDEHYYYSSSKLIKTRIWISWWAIASFAGKGAEMIRKLQNVWDVTDDLQPCVLHNGAWNVLARRGHWRPLSDDTSGEGAAGWAPQGVRRGGGPRSRRSRRPGGGLARSTPGQLISFWRILFTLLLSSFYNPSTLVRCLSVSGVWMYPLKDSAVVYCQHGLLCVGCRKKNNRNRVCWNTSLQLWEVSHETHH